MKISQEINYKKRTLLLIVVLFIVRFVLGAVAELGNDESYYWLYSQHLQWNYFDHPPLIGLWIRVFTFNLHFQSEGFIRLSSAVSCAAATWFIYQTGKTLHSEKAGWLSALFYSASFYASVTAGIYAMPDTPQMVFWTLCLWMLARISKEENNWKPWIIFGIAAGLCIMSKVHGVFIWSGLGLYILFQKRSWLLKPQLYIAGLLTLVIISPIIFWNIHYDFITYRFHSQRVIVKGFPFHADVFIREIWGQILNNNPISVSLIVMAMILFKKNGDYPALTLYRFIGIPLALLLIFISMFRNTLPHWNGPAYVSLFPLAAVWLADTGNNSIYYKLSRYVLPLFFTVLAGALMVIHFFPGTWGSKKTDQGKGDVTLDMYGWRDASKQFTAFRNNEVAKGMMPSDAPLVCHYWWGSHIEYYFCRPGGIEMIGLGHPFSLHHYLWTNKWRKGKVNMKSAYCIVPSDEYYYAPWTYKNYYNRIDSIASFQTFRGGAPAHSFYLYRLSGWKGKSIDEITP